MILFENVPSQRVFLYEQPFGGNLLGFLKVKLKKVPPPPIPTLFWRNM